MTWFQIQITQKPVLPNNFKPNNFKQLLVIAAEQTTRGNSHVSLPVLNTGLSSISNWSLPVIITLASLLILSIHYSGVIMGVMASQITSVSIVYSTVCSGTYQRKHQSSASLAFVRGIHRWPVNSPHKGQLRGKCFHLMTSSWNGTEIMLGVT